MKRMATLFVVASLLLGLGLAAAASLGPRGYEVTHNFTNNTIPYDILLTATNRTGDVKPAQFLMITASDSIRVVVMSPSDFLMLPAYLTTTPIGYEGKVNKYLRYRPTGMPLMIEGPVVGVAIYGPAGGNTVTVQVQAEY